MTMKLREEMFPLLGNKKTSTSRYGYRHVKVGEEILFVMTEDESVTFSAIVTKVTHCEYKDLTEEEAIKEGYASLEELKAVLERIYYPADNDTITLIEFVPAK